MLIRQRGERAGRAELRQAFADWLATLLRRLEGDAEPAPAHVGLNLEEVKMTLEERVAEWPKPYIRQGREEGISLGREEGIAHERRLLRRQAAARFGAATADRLGSVRNSVCGGHTLENTDGPPTTWEPTLPEEDFNL